MRDMQVVDQSVSLAIVGPSFFSYVSTVAREFSRRGITPFVLDEKHSNSNAAKIFYRLGLGHWRFSPLRRYLAATAERIIHARCTDVLIISPEVIDRNFVKHLCDAGLRVHLYSWDGSANKGGYIQYLDLLSGKGTFDPNDADRLGLEYFPLFAVNDFSEIAKINKFEKIYDISFCGTMHSSRSKIISEIFFTARECKLNLKLMLYYHSKYLFFIRSLFDWSGMKLLKIIKSQPFEKSEIALSMAQSHFVLDIAHPRQAGMTARTFEALICGARLLTNNPTAVDRLPLSLRNRIVLLDSAARISNINFRSIRRLPPLTSEETYYLSIERFVDQLLKLMGLENRDPASADSEFSQA